ncbi:MAG: phosphatidate cytidylyltransferase [Deltaproteobacteria bacterium]|jgi:phosphatidate cytidylyltransferase|nr:phosphatidate cytidylyltransferase [Deltaproteobacteria bacterium]
MSLPENLRKGQLGRWLVALILAVPTLVAIFSANNIWLYLLTLAIGAIVWWEYCVNVFGSARVGLMCLSALGWAAMMTGAYRYSLEGLLLGFVLALVLGAFYFMGVLAEGKDTISFNLISRYGLGHFYLSLTLPFVYLIKTLENGSRLLFFLILVTSLADTGAIYVGKRFKGPKLFVKVSPNKTISGLLGGCALATVAGGLSIYYLPADAFAFPELLLVSLGIALVGAFGDLFESAIKRAVGVKDTSTLLLGHGGFWDRLDSLLFNLPLFYFYVFWKQLP